MFGLWPEKGKGGGGSEAEDDGHDDYDQILLIHSFTYYENKSIKVTWLNR